MTFAKGSGGEVSLRLTFKTLYLLLYLETCFYLWKRSENSFIINEVISNDQTESMLLYQNMFVNT